MPCRIGIDLPLPSCGPWLFALFPLPVPCVPFWSLESASEFWFFLLGVNRLDLLRFFLELVGVELGVGNSLVVAAASLFVTLEWCSFALCGIANFGTEVVEISFEEPTDPVELNVPVLFEPILFGGILLDGGGIGGGTIIPLPVAVFPDVAKLPSSWYIG